MNNSLVLPAARSQLGPASIAGGMLLSGGATAALVLVGSISVTAAIPITGLVIGIALCLFGLIVEQQAKRIHPAPLKVPVEILSPVPAEIEKLPIVPLHSPALKLSFQQKATLGAALFLLSYGLTKWGRGVSSLPKASPSIDPIPTDVCPISPVRNPFDFGAQTDLNPISLSRDLETLQKEFSFRAFFLNDTCDLISHTESLTARFEEKRALVEIESLSRDSVSEEETSSIDSNALLKKNSSLSFQGEESSPAFTPHREDQSSIFLKVQTVVYGLGVFSWAVSLYGKEVWQKVSSFFERFSASPPPASSRSQKSAPQPPPPPRATPPPDPSSRPRSLGSLGSPSEQTQVMPSYRASPASLIRRDQFRPSNPTGALPPPVRKELPALSLSSPRPEERGAPLSINPGSHQRGDVSSVRHSASAAGRVVFWMPRGLIDQMLRRFSVDESSFAQPPSREDRLLTREGAHPLVFILDIEGVRVLLAVDRIRSQVLVLIQQGGRGGRRALIEAPAEPIDPSLNRRDVRTVSAPRLPLLREPDLTRIIRSWLWNAIGRQPSQPFRGEQNAGSNPLVPSSAVLAGRGVRSFAIDRMIYLWRFVQERLALQTRSLARSSQRPSEPPSLTRSDSTLSRFSDPSLIRAGRRYSLHGLNGNRERRASITDLQTFLLFPIGAGPHHLANQPHEEVNGLQGQPMNWAIQRSDALFRSFRQRQGSAQIASQNSARNDRFIPSSGAWATVFDYYRFRNFLESRLPETPSLTYDEFMNLISTGNLLDWTRNQFNGNRALPPPDRG